MTRSNTIISTLGFDQLQDMLRRRVLGPLGLDAVDQMHPMTECDQITSELDKVQLCQTWLDQGADSVLFGYSQIQPALNSLGIDDVVLSSGEVIEIFKILVMMQAVASTFLSDNAKNILGTEWIEYDPCSAMYQEVCPYFNTDYSIRTSAWPALKQIVQRRSILKQKIERRFVDLVQKYKEQGILTETEQSIRLGRRVLSVPAEYKRKIKGIMHDQSDTGKSFYIEPEEMVFLQNDLQELEYEYQRELRKMLRMLCRTFAAHRDALERGYHLIGRLDFLFAKAGLAITMKATKPQVCDRPFFDWRDAVHPLLFLKHLRENRPTVRFDYSLRGNNRVVVLSGPNAGGKSVCMKAVGLIQYMMQCGMPVPVDIESKMGVFSQFFIDLGDQQSIADDLSTYSSKLIAMKQILDNVDAKSLVLMDEFGSGTDPLMGGAIAEAWLDSLMDKKAWALLTTHYGNLKIFAFKRKGVINASMLFDHKALKPTYRLKLGKPGSSYALEIARQTGFDQQLIAYAKKRVGKKNTRVEDLLISLENEAMRLGQNSEKVASYERQLQQLINQYQDLSKEMEIRRKKFKLDKKQFEAQKELLLKEATSQHIKQLQKKSKIESAKEALDAQKLKVKKVHQELEEIKSALYDEELGEDHVFQIGDYVRLQQSGTVGKILSIQKNKIQVIIGNLKVVVVRSDLRPANPPIERRSKTVSLEGVRLNGRFDRTLDIRGYTRKEAMDVVQKYLDEALMQNVLSVKILHGKGSGSLRAIVAQLAQNYRQVHSIQHPEEEQGGDGVSIISFS